MSQITRYYDLTHEELVGLKEESIQRFVDIEIANAGIMPIVQPEIPSLEADGITRSVETFEVSGLLFANEEDAKVVVKMSLLKSNYEYAIGYDYKWVDPIVDAQINRTSYYKQEDVVRLREILQANTRKRDEYETKKQAYDKYLQETSKFSNEVWDTVNEAKGLQREIDTAKQTLEKYRGLSKGDDAIACEFFANTYKDREDLIKHVLGKEDDDDRLSAKDAV